LGNNGDGAVIIRVSDVIWPISTHNGNEGYQEKQTNHLLHCIRYLFNAPVIVEPNHQENYHFFFDTLTLYLEWRFNEPIFNLQCLVLHNCSYQIYRTNQTE